MRRSSPSGRSTANGNGRAGRLRPACPRNVAKPVATLSGDSARLIPRLSDSETVLRWSPDGRALWTFESAASKVWATDVATGQRQLLLTLGEPNGDNEFTALRLADDPKVYVYSRASHRSILFIVEGAR